MLSSEIRIGNLVYMHNTEHWPEFLNVVTEIKRITFGTMTLKEKEIWRKSDGDCTIKTLDGKEEFNQFNEYLTPIPLTEEWLFKFGFVEDGVWCHKSLNLTHERLLGFDLQNNHIFLGQWNKVNDSNSIKHNFRDTFLIKCEYVHQLQNLYFALTKTELTLS